MEKVIAAFDPNEAKKNLVYYKRDEKEIDGFRRRFWFKNEYIDFHVDLYEKHLYDFLENYNIGDVIDFSD